MKAAVYHGNGDPMTVDDIAMPSYRSREVLVKTAACGVCHSDMHVLTGNTPFPVPCILGHEISGVVAEVGADVTSVSPGDRVVASFILPCGNCRFCKRGDPELCSEFLAKNRQGGTLFDGTSRYRTHAGESIAMYSMGGLAEYCVVPENDVFALPDDVDLIEAAVLGCSIFTAFGAVNNVAAVGLGETVAVIGVGGVGSSIIAMARAAGASRVIAIDLEPRKLEAAVGLGASHQVDASGDVAAEVRAITDGAGADVCFEAIGTPGTVATALDICADGGRTVVVGLAPAGTLASVDVARMVRRKISLAGSYGANPGAAMPAVVRLAQSGSVSPRSIITDRFSLDEVNTAYDALAERKITGRAIVVIDA